MRTKGPLPEPQKERRFGFIRPPHATAPSQAGEHLQPAKERKALADLPMQVVALGPNQDITREGDRPAQCCLMLEGLACTYKLSGEGKRQIMAFHIAGDLPDLQSLHLDVLDNSLEAVRD